MKYMAFIILILLSSSTLVAPLCFGWFDYDDDDEPSTVVNSSTSNTTSTATPLLNCQALDDVFSYFNDIYEYLDQTFNPFYEPPTPTVDVTNTTLSLNATSTISPPT